jgi:Protein of unknown function (DUF2510)
MWFGYGHGGSSIFFVVLVIAVFALRMYAGRRRSHGGPVPRAPRSASFQGGRPPAGPPAGAPTATSEGKSDPSGWGVSGHTGIPAGWMVDPSGLHQRRYWSGSAWTDHVTDNGVPSSDPLPTRQPPASAADDAADGAPPPDSPPT